MRGAVAVKMALLLFAAGLATNARANPPARQDSGLVQLEQAYADALVRKDIAFLDRYYDAYWRGGDWMGFGTKFTLLNLLRDKQYVVKSMTLTDLHARIVGAVGIVQGIDEEVSSMHGRDTSGRWGFTDIFVRREGRWIAIASQTTKITGAR